MYWNVGNSPRRAPTAVQLPWERHKTLKLKFGRPIIRRLATYGHACTVIKGQTPKTVADADTRLSVGLPSIDTGRLHTCSRSHGGGRATWGKITRNGARGETNAGFEKTIRLSQSGQHASLKQR